MLEKINSLLAKRILDYLILIILEFIKLKKKGANPNQFRPKNELIKEKKLQEYIHAYFSGITLYGLI